MIMRAVSSQQSPSAPVREARDTQDSAATNWISKSLCHLSLKAGFVMEGVGIQRLAVISSLERDENSEGGLCLSLKEEKV